MEDMIKAFIDMNDDGHEDDDTEGPTVDPAAERLCQLASTPFFEGSRSTVLRTCLALLNLQTIYGWSDASVSSLFKLMKTSILPTINQMPKTRGAAKSIMADVGMASDNIHACPNDCVL